MLGKLKKLGLAVGISAVGLSYTAYAITVFSDSFEAPQADSAMAYLTAPIRGATVSSAALDSEQTTASGTTDSSGNLSYIKLSDGLQEIRVKGGRSGGSTVHGELRAVVASDNPSTVVNVTPLSDIAYRVVRHKSDRLSERNLKTLLDSTANVLIKTDINGDGAINYHDILAFVPSQHQSNLRFDYAELSAANANGDKILDAYISGNETLLTELYEDTFKGRLNFNLSGDKEVFDTRLELNVFGDGEVSSTTDIAFNSDNATNKTVTFVNKGDSKYTFSATPKDNTKIHSWDGCESVSTDKKTCTVSAKNNRFVSLNFAQKKVEVVNNLVVFDGHPVTISGNKLTIKLDKTESEMLTKAASVGVGTYLNGSYDKGYLYRVTTVNRLDLLTFEFTVRDAGFEEVIINGTAIFNKKMTHADLKDTTVSPDGRYYQANLGDPRLKLYKDSPESDRFTVGVMVPRSFVLENAKICDDLKLGFIYQSELTETTRVTSKTKTFSGEACLAINDTWAIVPAFSFEYDFHTNLDIRWGQFRGAEIRAKFTKKETVLFKALKKYSIKFNKRIFDKLFNPGVTFPLGPITVNITPQVELDFAGELALYGELEFGIENEKWAEVGFSFRKNRSPELLPILDVGENSRFAGNAAVGVSAKLGLDFKASLLIYKAVGPALGLEVSTEAKFEVDKLEHFKVVYSKNPCDAPPLTVTVKSVPYLSYAVIAADEIPFVMKPFIEPLAAKLRKEQNSYKFELNPYEKEIYKEPILPCDRTPAQIDVKGEAIKGQLDTARIITREYTVKNTGGLPLEWWIDFEPHPAVTMRNELDQLITPSRAQEVLGKNESTTVTLTVDYSKVPYGEFKREIKFVKKTPGLAAVFGISIDNVRKDIDTYYKTPEFPAPTNLTTEIVADNTILLSWNKPVIPSNYRADLVKHYRFFVKENCNQSGSDYQLYRTFPNVFGILNKFVYMGAKPGVDYCFAVQAAGDVEQSRLVQSGVTTLPETQFAILGDSGNTTSTTSTVHLVSTRVLSTATLTVEGTNYPMQIDSKEGTSASVEVTFNQLGQHTLPFSGTFTDGSAFSGQDTLEVVTDDSLINWITNPANGHQYTALNCGTWTQCQAKAVELGGNLVTIRNAAENQWLVDNLSNMVGTWADVVPRKNAWIGLSKKGDVSWSWVTGFNGSYKNWGASEPNNTGGNENWVVIDLSYPDILGQWVDLDFTSSWNNGSKIKWGIIEKTIPAPATIRATKLTATGITTCGNDTNNNLPCNKSALGDYYGLGQDGEIQAGQKMSYTKLTRNGAICVKDNVTGLIWEQKTDDGGLRDKDGRYSWKNAFKYIQQLNDINYCGYNNWELPRVEDYRTISDYSISQPVLPATFFPHVSSIYKKYWWTASDYKGGNWLGYNCKNACAWFYDTNNGGYGLHFYSFNLPVRAVRRNSKVENSFIKNNTIIHDKNTNLKWISCNLNSLNTQGCSTVAGTFSWKEALKFAKNFEINGDKNWRLPNIKELSSLIDYSKYNPAVDKAVFTDIESKIYWTSTPYHSTHNELVWSFNLVNGNDTSAEKSEKNFVILVSSE